MKIADIIFMDKRLILELTVPFMLSEQTHAVAISGQPNKFVRKNRKNIIVKRLNLLRFLMGNLFQSNKN